MSSTPTSFNIKKIISLFTVLIRKPIIHENTCKLKKQKMKINSNQPIYVKCVNTGVEILTIENPRK